MAPPKLFELARKEVKLCPHHEEPEMLQKKKEIPETVLAVSERNVRSSHHATKTRGFECTETQCGIIEELSPLRRPQQRGAACDARVGATDSAAKEEIYGGEAKNCPLLPD